MSNKSSIAPFAKILAVLFLTSGLVFSAMGQSSRPNVLFIVVDDLKPELGCYGSKVAHSPNIDQLAASSVIFSSAYCQQAICGPTRASVLTGWRPDHVKIWDLKEKIRKVNPSVVTLPQYFRQQGYLSIGMGKVFDPSNVDANGDSLSWSVPFKKVFPLAPGYEHIAFGIYQSPLIRQRVADDGDEDKDESQFYGPNKNQSIRYSTECLDVPDNAYMDGAMADYAIEQLKKLKEQTTPFFMAVGFKKPHLPFVAPKKYWNLYNRDSIQLAEWREKALNSPDVAYHNSGELRNYSADISSLHPSDNLLRLSEEKQKELIHGYYACVSYTDAQIGKLLQALAETGLDKNTIVVLWGDHGWHLGDHSLWCKHSNFEQATHVPLLIKAPGITKGQTHTGLVEFVDIYPTICDLAGLPVKDNLDGVSLKKILNNPSAPGKEFSISQYPRGKGDGPKEIMGYSLRTNQYRVTEWVNGGVWDKPYDPGKVVAVELYDYSADPLETKNLSDQPEMQNILNTLREKLHQYYTTALKKNNKL